MFASTPPPRTRLVFASLLLGVIAACETGIPTPPVPYGDAYGGAATMVVPIDSADVGIEESRYIPRYHLNPGDTLSVSFHFGQSAEDFVFKLSPGDSLQLKELYHEELNGTYLVRPDGIISLPYKGSVKAAGLSPEELVEYLTGLYEDIFREPSFSIQVKASDEQVEEFRSLFGSNLGGQGLNASLGPDGYLGLPLIGEIRAAGLTVTQAQGVLQGEYRRIIPKLNISVMLTSTAGYGVFVMGEVNEPGRYAISAPLTASRALALAKGHNPETADLAHVVLLSLDAATGKTTASFIDLESVIVRGDITRDPLIGPNDVLVIPSTTITKMDRWVDQYIAKLLMFRGLGASIGYKLEDV
jgi:polysaccharide export outer membrane protein